MSHLSVRTMVGSRKLCQELPPSSAFRRSFNSWHSIGSRWNKAPHTLNSPNENRYCSIRHCSKTAWISIICFHSSVENSPLDHQEGLDLKIFIRNSSSTFCGTRAFSALSRVSFPSRDCKKCHFSASDISCDQLNNGYGREWNQ